MPRFVDHARRRDEIIGATIDIISRDGLKGLTFNAVAKNLGGTVTLVTHYYKNKGELINDLASYMIQSYQEELDLIESNIVNPLERLHTFIRWALPTTAVGLNEEKCRIRLIAEHDEAAEIKQLFNDFDERMRRFMRDHLTPLVAPSVLESRVELLRIVTNGVCLSVVENPADWGLNRQLNVVNEVLALMHLGTMELDPGNKA